MNEQGSISPGEAWKGHPEENQQGGKQSPKRAPSKGASKAVARTYSKQGYALIYKPRHPMAQKNGYVRENRMVWYDAYGSIPRGFVVHHKDRVKANNALTNLECVSKAGHIHRHIGTKFPGDRKPQAFGKVECHVCKKEITRPLSIIEKGRRNGRIPCCSRKCNSTKNAHIMHAKRRAALQLANQEQP